MSVYFLYFCAFATAFFMFEAVTIYLQRGRDQKRLINDRMRRLNDLPADSPLEDILRAGRRRGANGEEPSLLEPIHELWIQSGVKQKPAVFLAISTAIAIAISIAVSFIVPGKLAVLVIFAGLLVAVPYSMLTRAKKRRILRFTRQLPNALDIIVRSLHAGHPVARAIDLVANEMPDPAGSEFGTVSDEMTYGLAIDQAMTHLYERIGAEDLRLLATTISVQRATGGNLGEILNNLSSVIRERFQMRGRIKALSSEGRVTAYMMAAFPVIMYALLSLIVPGYFDPFWESPFVVPVLILCAFLMTIGNFILFKMVNFDF